MRVADRATDNKRRLLHPRPAKSDLVPALLAVQALPMENQPLWRFVQLIALLAFEIGVENKTARIMTFQQHHARIGHAIRADVQRHRIGSFGSLWRPLATNLQKRQSGRSVYRQISSSIFLKFLYRLFPLYIRA